MSKKVYNKAPLSYQDQIALLENRGLQIPDKNKALAYLQEIGYYRLSAYFLPYQYLSIFIRIKSSRTLIRNRLEISNKPHCYLFI
jgi:abortive infection bacteriophage resistance protein